MGGLGRGMKTCKGVYLILKSFQCQFPLHFVEHESVGCVLSLQQRLPAVGSISIRFHQHDPHQFLVLCKSSTNILPSTQCVWLDPSLKPTLMSTHPKRVWHLSNSFSAQGFCNCIICHVIYVLNVFYTSLLNTAKKLIPDWMHMRV